MSTTIVIPVYNEAGNIAETLRRIQAQVKVDYTVAIVYDFDEDTTLPVATRVSDEEKIPVVFIKNQYGRGALNAIKTGLEQATSKYVVVTMADLSDPPSVINDMVAQAEQGGAAVVCGSRYMRGGTQSGGPLLKSLMSRAAGVSLRYIAGINTHDVTNSFKLYRKDFLDSVTIESTGGFEIGMELVVKAFLKGLKIEEVPTSWEDRAAGESRFQLRQWLPHYLKWYFKAIRGRSCRNRCLKPLPLIVLGILVLVHLSPSPFLILFQL